MHKKMGIFEYFFGSSADNDLTADYIGMHGEFDRNDEDRAICEDMFAMKSQNPDVDLMEHFGWENKLNYDCEGYDDELDF